MMLTVIPYIPSLADLREQLPLRAVCAHYGIDLDEDDAALCPFHDDHAPSFRLYASDDGVERWGCFPCGLRGDVIDLIRCREELLTFGSAVSRARQLLAALPRDARGSRLAKPAPPFDAVSLSLLLEDARFHARSHPAELCRPVNFSETWADTLVREWGWGLTGDGWVLQPHWDGSGTLTGIKLRGPDGRKESVPGSRYTHLYGSWRPLDRRPVLLCEGETDAVYAAAWYPLLQVRALPAGAGSFSPAWVSQLNRHAAGVILALDADAAGREATRKWRQELVYCSVLELPEGADLRTAAIPPDEVYFRLGL